MEEEVLEKVYLYINMLKRSAGKCDDQGVIECYKMISTMNIANMVLQ